MNTDLIRVAISGVTGRMGRQLVKILISSSFVAKQGIILTGAITRNSSEFVGIDVGELIGDKNYGVVIQDTIEFMNDFDVLIDFSYTQATLKYLDFCYKRSKNMVIGTTGFKEQELVFLKNAASKIGIVFSSNFSIGVNLMLKLLEKSAYIIGNISDIDIIEMHHRNKKDLPSGTACDMRQLILSVLNDCTYNKILGMFSCLETINRENKVNDQVKVHSIRAGNVIGEHSVEFINFGEHLQIKHQAFDRVIFAQGAMCAAIWLGKVKVGFFNMLHVLGLDEY